MLRILAKHDSVYEQDSVAGVATEVDDGDKLMA